MSRSRIVARLFGALLLIFLIMVFVGLDVLVGFLVGWVSFLTRVLPQITVNWKVIGMFVLCFTLILGGVQYFCSWLYTAAQKTMVLDSPVRSWSWRWTISFATGVCLLFFVGMAVVGVVHQVGWMVTSPEPLRVARFYGGDYINAMRQQDGAFQQALLEVGTNKVISYPELRKFVREMTRDDLREKIHTLVLEDEQALPVGMIAFARDPQRRATMSFLISTPETNDFLPAEQLPVVLKKYGGRLKAF